jgi:hypothetical protein
VIKPQFEVAFPFHDGLAPVKVDYKWGYIFTTGQFAVWPKYDGAHSFSEGLAMIRVGRATGYIDKTGRFIRGL